MRKALWHLVLIEVLVTVAGTLAGMFSVVFLVNSGFSPAMASLFYLQGFGWAVALCLAAANTGFGNPRHWMAAGILAQAAFYMSFIALEGNWLLVLAPAFFGLYIVGFWVPFNVLMLRHTSRHNRGEMIGYFFLVFPVIGLASPIIGGYLIDTVGYGILFACAFASLMANAVLIMRSKATHSTPMKGRLTLGNRESGIGSRESGVGNRESGVGSRESGVGNRESGIGIGESGMGKRLAAGLFFQGGQEGVWWTMVPLVSMLFVTSGLSLGYVFALINLAGGIASILVARISDRRGYRHRYVKAAAVACAPIIFGIALAPNLATYLVLAAAIYLVQPMLQILLFAMATDRMEDDFTSCSLSRELLLNTGRVLGGVLVSLVLFTSGDIRLAYAISGIMVLGIAVTR